MLRRKLEEEKGEGGVQMNKEGGRRGGAGRRGQVGEGTLGGESATCAPGGRGRRK